MPRVAADILITPSYDEQQFVAAVTDFADATERRSRPIFYEDVFTDFQDHPEAGAPIYTPDQLGAILRDYEERPDKTVTVRFYEPEVNLTDYDTHDLPPHTAFTYDPDADGGTFEISTADETILQLDDIVEEYVPDVRLRPDG